MFNTGNLNSMARKGLITQEYLSSKTDGEILDIAKCFRIFLFDKLYQKFVSTVEFNTIYGMGCDKLISAMKTLTEELEQAKENKIISGDENISYNYHLPNCVTSPSIRDLLGRDILEQLILDKADEIQKAYNLMHQKKALAESNKLQDYVMIDGYKYIRETQSS